jgi:hypothetical protein
MSDINSFVERIRNMSTSELQSQFDLYSNLQSESVSDNLKREFMAIELDIRYNS